MSSQKNVVFIKSHAHRVDVRMSKTPDINESYRDWKNIFLGKYPWLLNIPDDYIADKFNVYGLQEEFSFLNLCCDIICGKVHLNCVPQTDIEEIHRQLPQVYGMIHARFILSPPGLKDLKEKYQRKQYGTCPRLNCRNESLLPIGLSSQMRVAFVKVFCPCCREIFVPRVPVDLDGAYFGPNAAHIFIGEMRITSNHDYYQPFEHNAFGFKLRSCLFKASKKNDYDYDEE